MSVGNIALVLKSYSLWGEFEGFASSTAIKITATVRSGNQPLLTRGNKRNVLCYTLGYKTESILQIVTSFQTALSLATIRKGKLWKLLIDF